MSFTTILYAQILTLNLPSSASNGTALNPQPPLQGLEEEVFSTQLVFQVQVAVSLYTNFHFSSVLRCFHNAFISLPISFSSIFKESNTSLISHSFVIHSCSKYFAISGISLF